MDQSGAVTPLVIPLDPPPDPIAALRAVRELPYPLLLDGAGEHSTTGRYSYLMADPVDVIRDAVRPGHDPLAAGEALLDAWRAPRVEGLPPFQGGLAGYLGYEYGRALERMPVPPHDPAATPDVLLGLYDWTVAWDHAAGQAWLIAVTPPGASAIRTELRAEAVQHLIARAPPGHPVPPARSSGTALPRSSFTRTGYVDAVTRVRDYILAGDVFQVNLSQRFETWSTDDPIDLYGRLRAATHASHGAFFDAGDHEVLSASPELFLRVDGRRLETRPIKGTRPRGADPDTDAALARELRESEKDCAENVMIVDLLRNDLSRVAEPGSVVVEKLLALEQYPTVHHLVSTVTATLRPGLDAFDAIRAAFPGGSITGAPKVRAMEIIAELEPVRRGPYCGSIGYISRTGDAVLSVGIRTVIRRDGVAHIHAGGGIVVASDSVAEYDETVVKARALLDAVAE